MIGLAGRAFGFLGLLVGASLPDAAHAFDPARASRYSSPDFYRPNVDGLIVRGQGSEGDISGMSSTRPGGVARTFTQQLADQINLKDLIAGVCQGDASKDTAALSSATLQAAAKPGSTIYLPACAYKFTAAAGTFGFRLPSSTTFAGSGPKTVITWNDASASDSNPLYLFGPNDPGVRTSDIMFQDFTVHGSAATTNSTTAYPFLLSGIDGLTIRGVTSEYSRSQAIAVRGSTNVSADNNVVRYSKSDGINISQSTRVSIRNNDISHTNDDAIGVHSDIYDAEGVRDTVVVTGNRIFDAQGIRVLSGRKSIITANVLTNVRQFGISLETLVAAGSGFQEGAAATEASLITSNVITNVLDRSFLDNFNAGANAIVITGTSARKGNLAAVPGDAGSGVIPDPYKEGLANSSSASVATPGSAAVIISGNILARTLPASNGSDPRFRKWSDFGQGPIWTQNGNVDPSMPEAALQSGGIQLRDGVIRDVQIFGNTFRGLSSALIFGAGQRFDNITFRGNQIVDMSFTGIVLNTSAKLRLYVDGNLFDLDPFLKAAARGPNGTWTSAGAPFAVFQQAGAGVFLRNNTFRNMGQIFNQGFGAPGFFWAENMVEADATTFGSFATTNKGIGNVPANSPAFRYVRVGSDPANDNFGTVLAMPPYP